MPLERLLRKRTCATFPLTNVDISDSSPYRAADLNSDIGFLRKWASELPFGPGALNSGGGVDVSFRFFLFPLPEQSLLGDTENLFHLGLTSFAPVIGARYLGLDNPINIFDNPLQPTNLKAKIVSQ